MSEIADGEIKRIINEKDTTALLAILSGTDLALNDQGQIITALMKRKALLGFINDNIDMQKHTILRVRKLYSCRKNVGRDRIRTKQGVR